MASRIIVLPWGQPNILQPSIADFNLGHLGVQIFGHFPNWQIFGRPQCKQGLHPHASLSLDGSGGGFCWNFLDYIYIDCVAFALAWKISRCTRFFFFFFVATDTKGLKCYFHLRIVLSNSRERRKHIFSILKVLFRPTLVRVWNVG